MQSQAGRHDTGKQVPVTDLGAEADLVLEGIGRMGELGDKGDIRVESCTEWLMVAARRQCSCPDKKILSTEEC